VQSLPAAMGFLDRFRGGGNVTLNVSADLLELAPGERAAV
jgi:hypothetical protein